MAQQKTLMSGERRSERIGQKLKRSSE